jgi:microcystin-dependent protein
MAKSYRKEIHGKAPYFDDFDENKKFLRVMFRPGYPLQAREVTQLQTIVQNQIEQLGSHLFEDGTSVRGGDVSEANATAIRLSGTTFTDAQLQSFLNKTVTNGTVSAKIISYADASLLADDNNQIFFVNYTTAGGFTSGDVLTVESTLPVVTVTIGSNGDAPAVSTATNVVCVNSGVFYADGFLVTTTAQSFAAYNEEATYRNFNNPTASVGFKVNREIVTSDDDESLNDPSFGYFNFNSPGANRYKIDLTLSQIDVSASTGITLESEDYLELVRVINGETTKTVRFTDYAIFEETLARRTFDESGNYTVKPFSVNPVEYDSVFTGSDTNKHAVRVEPGKAYVSGFEYETIAPTYLPVDRALTVNDVYNERLTTTLGNYVTFNPTSSRDVDLNYSSGSTSLLFNRKGRILKVSGGVSTVIGTCNIRSVEVKELGDGTLEHRLYLFNIKLTSDTLKFKDSTHIECIDPSTDTIEGAEDLTQLFQIGLPTVATVLKRANGSRQIFKVPKGESVLTTFGDGSFQNTFLVKKAYDVNFTGTSKTITSNHDFLEGTISNYAFFYTDSTDAGISGATLKAYGTDYNVSVNNTTQPKQLTVNLLGSIPGGGRGTLVASQLYRTSIASGGNTLGIRFKTITNGSATGKTGSVNTGIIPLNNPDVFELTSIVDTGGRDVTNEFELDRNDTVDCYRRSRIILKPGSTCAVDGDGNYNVDATYKFFSHSGDGPFTVDSYPRSDEFGYSDIPIFTDPETGERYSLTDAYDFRPVVQDADELQFDNGSGGPATVAFENGVTPSRVTYRHYLPRIDKVVLTKNRQFILTKGTPSLNPQGPEINPQDMDICDLVMTPFTSTPDDIRVRYVDNQRSTMKEIAENEKVQQNDQYFIFKNDLEQLALNRAVSFKSTRTALGDGIFVDSMIGHNNGLVSGRDHNCSVDPETNELRPAFESDLILLTAEGADIPSSVTLTDDGIFVLNSTPDGFDANDLANTTINANRFAISDYLGTCKLTPASDNYFSTTIKPKVVVNTVGEMDNWEADLNSYQRGRSRGFGAQWRDWESIWFGSKKRNEIEIEHDPLGKEYETVRKSSYLKRVLSDKIIRKVGDKIVDLSVVPYVRNRTVAFDAKNMKPGSTVYAFFDGSIVGTTSGYSVDSFGAVSGSFSIPNNTFLTGEKLFRLIDNSSNTINLASTSADAVFYAQGLLDTNVDDITSVRPPITRRKASNVEDVTDDRFTANQKNNLSTSYNSQTPFAQEIFVDSTKYPNGVMLKQVSVIFKEKPSNDGLPIKLHVRPMFDGAPDPYKVLPFSEVTKNPSDVSVSSPGPSPAFRTTFTFSTPVYLKPRKSYAICLTTNASEYEIWLGQEGELALNFSGNPSTSTVTRPNSFVALHKPSNNGAYTPVTDEYLAMDIDICSFPVSSSTVRFVSNRGLSKQYHVGFVPMNTQLVGEAQPSLSLKTRTYDAGGGDPTSIQRAIQPNQTLEFDQKMFANDQGIADSISKSVQLEATLTTDTTGRVCTMIDNERVDFLAVEYMANKNTAAADIEEVEPTSRQATNRSRYVSRKVTLNQQADDIAVFVEGSVVGDSVIKAYVKVQGVDSPEGNFDDNNWIPLYIEGNSDSESFDQFKPLGDAGGVMRFTTPPGAVTDPSSTGEFNAFQIKLVLMGAENNTGSASAIPIIGSIQAVPLRRSNLDEIRRFIPVGTILAYGSEVTPEGFLPCDGQYYDVRENPELEELYNVIGKRFTFDGAVNPLGYGKDRQLLNNSALGGGYFKPSAGGVFGNTPMDNGSDSTWGLDNPIFRVPSLNGRFLMGQVPPNSPTLGSNHGVGDDENVPTSGDAQRGGGPINSNQPIMVGRCFGRWRHTLSTEEIPSHKHTIRRRGDLAANGSSSAADLNGSAASNATTNDEGNDFSHTNVPQCVSVHYIIKI